MGAIIDSRKRNLPKQISDTYEELENIFKCRSLCANFMNEQSDLEALTKFFAEYDKDSSKIKSVRAVNMRLIRRPYIQADVGVRTDQQILEMLRERLELATHRVNAFIAELEEPFGKNTVKIIMAKRNYYLRLVGERNALSWRTK